MATKGERTRKKILVESKELFKSKGFTATSMRDIAEATGISPGALYNHFPGKDQLFETMIHEHHPIEEIINNLQISGDPDPETFLRRNIKTFVNILMQHEDYIRLGLIDAQERDGKAIQSIPPKMFPICVLSRGMYRLERSSSPCPSSS